MAISYYISFAAPALHQYPACKQKLQTGDQQYAKWFVQEIRRFYPFAPFIGAPVRKDFEWRNYPFKKGTLVLLDLYGTNHDEALWKDPEIFRPERFKEWDGSPFNFIPQGGGEHLSGHPCAGVWLTIEATKVALQYMANHINYEVPPQDLHLSLTRMPTRPASGFVIKNVKRKFPHAPNQLKPLVTTV